MSKVSKWNRKSRIPSSGELAVRTWLVINGISFTEQHVMKGCVNKRTNCHLIFDFYLHEHNTVIEFDGSQHFTYTPCFHNTKSDFISQVSRDRQKNNYCRVNNLKLIRIPFYDKSRIYRILSTNILKTTDKTEQEYEENTRLSPFQEDQAVF